MRPHLRFLKHDLLVAPVGESTLVLLVGTMGWAAHAPLLFTSLGPTVYELIEKPTSNSARTYNIIVGHFVGLGAGFFGLWVLHAWSSPKVAASGFITSSRLWAGVVAVGLTTLLTLALKAGQPAALSTTLLVSLGSMQSARDAVAIAAAVLIVAAVGAPVRRRRAEAAYQSESVLRGAKVKT